VRSPNWFLIGLEIPLREIVELAEANWTTALLSAANNPQRKDLIDLTDQLLEDATKMEVCWTLAGLCARDVEITDGETRSATTQLH
jgi:hypothetical protein